jgi:hypothetical protein
VKVRRKRVERSNQKREKIRKRKKPRKREEGEKRMREPFSHNFIPSSNLTPSE